MGVMFARALLALAALMLAEPSVRAAPSSVTSGVIPPPFPWSNQLTARQLSSEECNRVCEGPTKEYYEGKGCSVPESLSTCCTDQFISDYVQCNVCRRNNDQNSLDYPGIQATLNNWGTWCANNGRPVRMSYLPGQSPATSTPPPQTTSATTERPAQTTAITVTTSRPPAQTSSTSPTSTSEGKSTVSDPPTSTQTSTGSSEAEGQGLGGTGLSDEAVAGGGAPRPTDQSRVSEQQRAGNSAQSIIHGKIWSPREGSLQKALAIPMALAAVLM